MIAEITVDTAAESEVRPAVTAIIVTYNSSHVIRHCLDTINNMPDVEVIVIDNDSSDGCASLVREEYPSALVIESPVNAGFAKAVNLAAHSATGDVLLLLNPDATIDSSVLRQLLSHLVNDSQLAVVAPVLSDAEGEFHTVSAGFEPSLLRMFSHLAGISRFGRYYPQLRGHYLLRDHLHEEVEDVDWVSGGCLMVKKIDWDALGGLSERWFMYAEDIDFCLRIRKLGRGVRLCTQLKATHAIGGSSSNVDGRVNTAWIENLFDLYCMQLSRSRLDKEVWRLIVFAGFAGRAVVCWLRMICQTENRLRSRNQVRRYWKFSKSLYARKNSPLRS